MFWCISVGLLISYLITNEMVMLISSGLFGIAASLGAIANRINKIADKLDKEKEVQL